MKETESKQSKKLEENGKSGTEAAKKLQDLRLVGCCGDPRGCLFCAVGGANKLQWAESGGHRGKNCPVWELAMAIVYLSTPQSTGSQSWLAL